MEETVFNLKYNPKIRLQNLKITTNITSLPPNTSNHPPGIFFQHRWRILFNEHKKNARLQGIRLRVNYVFALLGC